MFNEKSTDTERRERLEDLLKKKATDSDSEDEIPDDEQINEILARGEEEFKFYEQLDRDRYEKEKFIYKFFRDPAKNEGKFINYRLLNADETPDWVKADNRVDESKKEYGRGNRVRKQVSYIDDVEEQAKADDAVML
jgi:ATP-dependent helicase STH1/SNF2